MNIIAHARRVVAMETEALLRMGARMGAEFERAVQLVTASEGRVIVIGMGKSGHIGRKIAATMASTGTASFFVHPGEAFHGDLGMIRPEDVLLLISNSGETDELVRLLPFLQQQGNPMIAMTGKPQSMLGRSADVVLDIGVESEACSNNLAPTSSTTATLVMGDALAVTLSVMKGFQPEDFARFHPGGSLGRKLLTRVQDVMTRQRLPCCSCEASFREVVHAITRGRMGLVLVGTPVRLQGIITDGDIRRAFEHHNNPMVLRAHDIMCARPHTIAEGERLSQAESLMRQLRIHALVAMDAQGCVSGVVQLVQGDAAEESISAATATAGGADTDTEAAQLQSQPQPLAA
jgi:arabinose-5-phosphate isomerase